MKIKIKKTNKIFEVLVELKNDSKDFSRLLKLRNNDGEEFVVDAKNLFKNNNDFIVLN